MKTFLAIDATGELLILKCEGCGNVTDLRKMLGPGFTERVKGINCINTLRLAEYMGKYGMEHSSCRPKPDPT